MPPISSSSRVAGTTLAVAVASLGFFVDAYDILIFSVVRIASLTSIGVSGDDLTRVGMLLLNLQFAGMVLGGLLWGTLGDKRGRLSVLFGSILLYSLANLANGFTDSVPAYAVCRFLAGVGLAGELGAGVTLAGEILRPESRGWGTMCIGVSGVLGGIFGTIASAHMPWRSAFFLGGVMGLLLLAGRVRLAESPVYRNAQNTNVPKGSLWLIMSDRSVRTRYILCVILGSANWLSLGIYMTLSPEIGMAAGVGDFPASRAMLTFFIGLATGEVSSSFLSQLLRSRKRAIATMIGCWALGCVLFLVARQTLVLHAGCLLLGYGAGYWTTFLSYVSELFGTNIRATATVSVPNLVRALVIPLSALLTLTRPALGLHGALWLLGGIALLAATVALLGLPETFGQSLDFVDQYRKLKTNHTKAPTGEQALGTARVAHHR